MKKFDLRYLTVFLEELVMISTCFKLASDELIGQFSGLRNYTLGLFFQAAKEGVWNLAGCGKFSTACIFYCTPCNFYCTADARSDSENLQKFLKNWLFWTFFVSLISKPIYVVIFTTTNFLQPAKKVLKYCQVFFKIGFYYCII